MVLEYDIIFLGTGHNALVAQAYLARSGLRTLCLERAENPGGGLATIKNPRLPGFVHNPHSFFHRGINIMPWYRDLELKRHGLKYIEPELNVALYGHNGRRLEWWTDLNRTIDSFATFSKKDAATLRRWVEEFEPIVKNILTPEAQSPPLPNKRRIKLLKRTAIGRRLLEVSALSPLEFIAREFENDTIRAGLLFFNGLREIDLRQPGFGHAIPALLASPARAQMCEGGSVNLARALINDIKEHSGEIRCCTEIKQIRTKNNAVNGIELSNGEYLKTSTIVSGLNPQQTFIDLLPSDVLPVEIRKRVEQFQYNLIAPLFGLHLALNSPATLPGESQPLMYVLGLDRFNQFKEIVRAHELGEIPAPVTWGACPTIHDPSQAPAGKHTAFLWEKLPYALHGNSKNWETEKDQHGQHLLKFWSEHSHDLTGNVLDQFTLSPADTEATLPNMVAGDLLVGSFANGQVGENRPFPGAGKYRTPVKGLYLCGGSTHPGGNITGLCGYNAARVLIADAGVRQWWKSPDIESHLADLKD